MPTEPNDRGRATRIYEVALDHSKWWLPALTFGVYSATAAWTAPVVADAYGTALEAWTLANTGSPWLDHLLPGGLDTPQEPYPNWLFTDAGGRAVSTRTIGVVLAAAPFSLLSPDGFAIWPSTLAAVLLSTLAVAWMHRGLLNVMDPRSATLAALVFAFATPTWSVSAQWLFPQSLTQASIAGAVLAATRDRWWLVGVALGLGITGRAHLAVVAAVLGAGVAIARRRPSLAIAVGTPSAAGVAVVVASNAWRYGAPSIQGGQYYATDSLTDSSSAAWVDYGVNALGFAVSPGRGLLVWTPLALILAPAVVRYLRSSPDWTRFLLLGGLAYALVQLKINNFSGGDTFVGYRLGLEMMTCALPLYALAWATVHEARIRPLVGIATWLQFVMVAVAAIAPASAGLYLTFTPLEHPWRQHVLLVAALRTPILLLLVVASSLIALWLIRSLDSRKTSHVTRDERRTLPDPSTTSQVRAD